MGKKWIKNNKRIRWHLKENHELLTFFVNPNHMDNENDIEKKKDSDDGSK